MLAAADVAPDGAPDVAPDGTFVSQAKPGELNASDFLLRLAAQRTARSVVERVARRQIIPLADGDYERATWADVQANRAPQGITWAYPWGVTLYGMLRASQVTGDTSYADFALRHNEVVARYYAHLREVQAAYSASRRDEVDALVRASPIRGLMELGSLDNCGAMSTQMLEGVLQPGAAATDEQEELLGRVARYISTGQSRLPDGALWRPEQSRTLWVDDLYMSCPFLARWSRRTGDRRFVDDAARQVIAFAGRQQDADGLWFHGNFVRDEGRPDDGLRSPFKWGRGNGWAMVSTVEVLSALPDDHPDRARLLAILRRHVAGVARLQAPSGRWRQVLDHPEMWEETSCTAMFTYAIARAVRRGWLPREDLRVAWRGLAGLAENVTPTGEVNGTGWGTAISTDLNYYATIYRPPNDAHGPGPVLLAAAEVLAESLD